MGSWTISSYHVRDTSTTDDGVEHKALVHEQASLEVDDVNLDGEVPDERGAIGPQYCAREVRELQRLSTQRPQLSIDEFDS